MPGDTVAHHPSGLEITFREAEHTYTDGTGRLYTSVTTLVKEAFPQFDAERAARTKEEKTGVPADEWIRRWAETAEAAAASGTRMHENCERQILGQKENLNQPVNDEERLRFRAAWREVSRMQREFSSLKPEMVVFSPRFGVSGSIDCLAMSQDGGFTIIDWKVVKEIRYEGFKGRTGTHPATTGLQDSNYYHYALQLSTYEQILRLEGYVPQDARIARRLNVYRPDGRFERMELPDLRYEALLMMSWHATEGMSNWSGKMAQ